MIFCQENKKIEFSSKDLVHFESQLPWDQKHLFNLFTKDFIIQFLHVWYRIWEIQSTAMFPQFSIEFIKETANNLIVDMHFQLQYLPIQINILSFQGCKIARSSWGSEFFGFGYCLEDKLRVRVSSGLNISVKFGFGYELSGLSGFTGLKMLLKVQFFYLIFQLLP